MANFNFNRVIIGGRLTAEPELKQTTSGIPVLSFSVAVNRRAAKGQERVADFINCRAWRERAELISRYFHKGSSICVVGTLQQNNWTDQQGVKRYATDIVADEISFVDSRNEGPAAGQGQYTPDAYTTPSYSTPADSAPKFEEIKGDDDLPF
jgi:single-strand DNA-binding protein